MQGKSATEKFMSPSTGQQKHTLPFIFMLMSENIMATMENIFSLFPFGLYDMIPLSMTTIPHIMPTITKYDTQGNPKGSCTIAEEKF